MRYTPPAMKVIVDASRCQGHTVCNMIAPEIFELSDEDGHAFVLIDTVPAQLEAKVQRAAANCPERAVLITE